MKNGIDPDILKRIKALSDREKRACLDELEKAVAITRQLLKRRARDERWLPPDRAQLN